MQADIDDGYDSFFVAEYPRLVTMLSAWWGRRPIAEELAQDALLQAYRNWATVRELDRPGTWVRRVALNRSSNESRRRRRERAALARAAAASGNVEQPALTDEHLWRSVRRLSPAQRDATILRYVDDLPLADIATILGCSEGTVKTHLQRARHSLAAALRDTEAAR